MPNASSSPGFNIPETTISLAAYNHASSQLASPILSHSIRVYLYAAAYAKALRSIYCTNAAKNDLLFTACLFHDIGTCKTYDGPLRFEIEGGDAATAFLAQHGVSEADQKEVWIAIACHTSPQIAERIGELAKIVRLAVLTDFHRTTEASDVLEPLRGKLEADFARDGIEKCLGDAVVEQVKTKPGKAPTISWPGALLEAALKEPTWDGVNKAF